MKSQKIIVSCLISIMLVAVASADWKPLTDEIPLSILQGQTLIFGDKVISDIHMSGIIATGGAIAPDANSVFIQGGYNDITLDYGLRFNLAWIAGPNQTINTDLDFKVSVLDDFEDFFIKDVILDITGASANGTGAVVVGESVRDLYDSPLAHLSCSAYPGSSFEELIAGADFAPVKSIWIHSKDISITGGTNGSAHLSQFYQYYSQVPEPATIILFGTVGIWIFNKKNKFV